MVNAVGNNPSPQDSETRPGPRLRLLITLPWYPQLQECPYMYSFNSLPLEVSRWEGGLPFLSDSKSRLGKESFYLVSVSAAASVAS